MNETDVLWYEGDTPSVDEDEEIVEYDITASPNDFNVKTIFDFLESKVVKIPGFQRNYVWDIKRASKLIESLIIGLPIPQVFLYEQSRNNFLVIDGQQRLLSIYYFIKQRFPKKEKRSELREIFDKNGKIPDDILYNDTYFTNFNLKLPESLPGKPNRFHKLNYETLGEYKTTFELRTIRNIIIKQNQPEDDSSSIYEIFNRLNTGGLNLKPQEIRTSLYHSDFYDALVRINLHSKWRELLGQEVPDLHMKDVEILLRGFAMLFEGKNYKPSMTKFLNKFSRNCRSLKVEDILYLENLFYSFLTQCSALDSRTFVGKSNKFNISVFESVFAAVCEQAFEKRQLLENWVNPEVISRLKDNEKFIDATQSDTASKENVTIRLNLAREEIARENG